MDKNDSEISYEDMITFKMNMMDRILDSIFTHLEAFRLLFSKVSS